MRPSRPRFAQVVLTLSCVFFASLRASGQANSVPSRVTQAIDEEIRVTLRGNTHPLARPEFDRGAAPDEQPMRRMLLLLKRSPEQEAALGRLLDEQQMKSSPNYHHWLTPEQFGRQFGPADSDVQAVTDWLGSKGFEVTHVSTGRTVMEFSGTAGQVRKALHTEIHRFAVDGEEHWANASDPEVPAALAPVVAGIVSLNNFPRKPLIHSLGAFSRSKLTGKVEPLYTVTSNGTIYYALGPTDFATIYNVLPLWQAGFDGTGQTIAIVGESNINASDAASFRSMWNLPAKAPQIILNGPDPGIRFDEGEADADTQWAGAVAKGATIDLVVSETTETTAGIDLSALYIIDNNIAPVMSESYGSCESDLGATGNAFYNSLWQQGAAQGITIVIAAGDTGSDVCDYARALGSNTFQATHGLSVSGTASTPFNIAVGGTDFDDVSSQPTYWNSTNNPSTESSAKSYIPETTWNNSCARTGLTGCNSGTVTYTIQDLTAGSGSPSSCSQVTSGGGCVSGYTKPAWQSGTGVPNDGVRDLPDVSLYAAYNSLSNSIYAVCESDQLPGGQPCSLNAFLGVGGTSLSAPAFAGIMAMVVQKTSERQGNANYVLYPLAAQSGASCTSDATALGKTSCIFYDTVTGNNSVACQGGTPNCSNTGSGYGVLVDPNNPTTPAWTTTAGYDLATGLGSVNAANLVNQWSSVSFTPTTTTLSLSTTPPTSPLAVTHGQPVNVNVSVTSSSGTPTGSVSLIGGPNNANLGIDFTTLSGGSASGTTVFLPGGTYGVTAHYAGDGTFGASDSTPPVQVTVSPESSATKISLVTFDANGNLISSNATSAPYESNYLLRIDVTNASGNLCAPQAALLQYACPSGKVAVTADGAPLDAGTYPLDSQGYTEDQKIQLNGGTHPIVANYSGDGSYNASTGNASLVITPMPTQTTVPPVGQPVGQVSVNASFSVMAFVSLQGTVGALPTGTVTFLLDGTQLPGTITGLGAGLDAMLSTSVSTLGQHTVSATYSGDANYASSTSSVQTFVAKYAPVVTMSSNLQIVDEGGSLTLTAFVDTTNKNLPPTGGVVWSGGGPSLISSVTPTTDPQGNSAGQASGTYTPTLSGTITAEYQGDSNYWSAASNNSVYVTVFPGTGSDFGFQITDVVIEAPGQSGSAPLNLIPSQGTSVTVALTCAVPATMAESSCSLSPASVALTDQKVSTALLTVTTTGPHLVGSLGNRLNRFNRDGGIVFACLCLLIVPILKRRPRLVVAGLLLALFVAGSLSCGGGGGGGGGGGTTDPGTLPGVYSMTVTGTATINGASISHTATLTVNVQ